LNDFIQQLGRNDIFSAQEQHALGDECYSDHGCNKE
jgi:hypothetical protein